MIKIGDKVRIDPTKATLIQALGNDGSVGTVKRLRKSGSALVEWRTGFTETPVNILEVQKTEASKALKRKGGK